MENGEPKSLAQGMRENPFMYRSIHSIYKGWIICCCIFVPQMIVGKELFDCNFYGFGCLGR